MGTVGVCIAKWSLQIETHHCRGSEFANEMTVATVLKKALLEAVRERFLLDWHGIHGAPHWARVRLNGLAIAAQTGARTDVIELFAFLHDSKSDLILEADSKSRWTGRAHLVSPPPCIKRPHGGILCNWKAVRNKLTLGEASARRH